MLCWYNLLSVSRDINTRSLTVLGWASTLSWSRFMPGITTVIFRGPLKPSTLVSWKQHMTIPLIIYLKLFITLVTQQRKQIIIMFIQVVVVIHLVVFVTLLWCRYPWKFMLRGARNKMIWYNHKRGQSLEHGTANNLWWKSNLNKYVLSFIYKRWLFFQKI